MRPRGEVREVMGQAVRELAAEQGYATWRMAAERACVGYDVARATVGNMLRAREVMSVGPVRQPHSRRPMLAIVPATGEPAPCGDEPSLDDVLREWQLLPQ